MANYRLSRSARLRLTEIYEYSFATFGERHADAYLSDLYDTFDKIAAMPGMGRVWRKWRRHEHREYVIFYLAETSNLEIVDILHHREDVARKLK